jgi:RNA polymerase sigma factor (sigma-70 family)
MENPVGYARTTLLNTYLSHRRLRRNSEQPSELSTDDGGAVAAVDPADRLDLLAALATLDPLDRAVVVLRYWEDRSVADVALDLGLTETTVRTRARRSLQRLRPHVSERTTS